MADQQTTTEPTAGAAAGGQVQAIVSDDLPTNCNTCGNKFPSYNQCRHLVGHTENNSVITRADEIRKWRSTVGLHDDWSLTDKYIEPTDTMTGCPCWCPAGSR